MQSAKPQADLTAFVEKVESTDAVIGVVGLGYVGLPVAMSFAEGGFRVHGIDLDQERINKLNAGESYLGDVPSEQIRRHREPGRFSAGSS